MAWLNTSIRFPRNAALLTISRSDLDDPQADDRILQSLYQSLPPVEMADVMRRMIVAARPELTNCCILGFEFSMRSWQWEIAVDHPLLPAVKDGECLQAQPLVRREGQPLLTVD